MTTNQDELSGLEKGLLSHKGRLEWSNKQITNKLDVRTKFTIELLKDNPEKLKLLKELNSLKK